jgi:predicted ArsR family transcriptional regulator
MSRLDVIADPVRLAVARFLGRGPASTAEVADGVGIHLNTARSHLRALVEAGVASRVHTRGPGRGRPLVRYRLERGWVPSGDEMLGLARLLATALEGAPSPAAERARRWGQQAVASGKPDETVSLLERLGFEAALEAGELTLTNCPCPLVSAKQPALVCRLVDAAIEGALAAGEARVRSRRHDPEARCCHMALAPA